MRADDDLTAYVAARWPVLVRTLALLGCPDQLVADVALDGLARSRRSWPDVGRGADPDVLVLRALLGAWAARRRTDWWVGVPPPEADPDREPAESALDRLPSPAREAVVLHDVAGLGVERVADVLEVPAGAVVGVLDGWSGGDTLLRAAEAVPVLAAPDDTALVGRGRSESRRRRGRVLAGAGVAALVGGALAAVTWTAGGDPAPAADDPEPTAFVRERNPVGSVWWAEGRLHLPDTVVEVPSARGVVAVADGAVVTDGAGRVTLVEHDGERTELGRTDPAVPVVGAGIFVAWQDLGGGLVLVDLAAREEVLRVPGTRLVPVAVDGRSLFYNDDETAWRVDAQGVTSRIAGVPLLDARGGTRVFQRDPTTLLSVPTEDPGGRVLSGRGAVLGVDGRLLLTRPVRAGQEISVRDAVSGERLPSGVGPEEELVAAGVGAGGTVTYVVAPGARPVGDDGFGRRSVAHAWTLRTCAPEVGLCEDVAQLSGAGAVPVVAR